MTIHRPRPSAQSAAFAGFRFPPDVIMLAVRWYLRYNLSYRDVEELLAERGIQVDHVSVFRWVQRFTPLLIEAARPLWDGEVVALLDFEFAVLGPVEIDLCRLVCEALVSEDEQRSDNDAGAAAFAIAARERDPVHGRALLLGAAVLDQLRDLEIWLGRDRTEDRFEDWRPDRLLTGL